MTVPYRLTRTWYAFTRLLETRLFGTRLQEAAWRYRHLYRWKWAERYSQTVNHPHRPMLADRIAAYRPASVLEVGANVGANLHVLARRLPQASLYGVDINPAAVEFGRRSRGDLNIELNVGRADNLSQFSDCSFDVVFSDATLVCVGPDKIAAALKEMRRVARWALVLSEYQADREFYFDGHWVRDYRAFFPHATLTKIPDEVWGGSGWSEYGYIVEVPLLRPDPFPLGYQ